MASHQYPLSVPYGQWTVPGYRDSPKVTGVPVPTKDMRDLGTFTDRTATHFTYTHVGLREHPLSPHRLVSSRPQSRTLLCPFDTPGLRLSYPPAQEETETPDYTVGPLFSACLKGLLDLLSSTLLRISLGGRGGVPTVRTSTPLFCVRYVHPPSSSSIQRMRVSRDTRTLDWSRDTFHPTWSVPRVQVDGSGPRR